MPVRRAPALMLAALAAVTILCAGTAALAPGARAQDGPGITVVLFHGDGCPHCAAERAFLDTLVAENPEVTVEAHEVWYDEDGQALLLQTADDMGFEPTGVPVTIIGDRVWIGFDDTTAREITAIVESAGAPEADPAADPQPTRVVDVPLLGDVDVGSASLLAATVAIGFVDGVNPCSLWVLSLLLAMVLNRGSRGRVLLVGGVFLGVTALMYGLYMIGLYSAASYLSGMGWLRLVVAGVAGVLGALQFKDGLGISTGPSLSIADERRPGIYARMRAIASPERALAATLTGTVVLAVAVSLLETPCTAGLPLLWTTLLAEQQVGLVQAVWLFAVYLLVFLLDELIVFVLAVVTLRATRVQERHGRVLKLVAGSVLLCLAATMLVAPTALSTVAGTAIVFTAAALLTLTGYLVSNRLTTPGPRAPRPGPA